MTAAALTTKLQAVAHEIGLRPGRPMFLRRVQEMLKEVDGDEARVELVVRWIIAQEQERFRPNRLGLDKFYAVGRDIECPDGAWDYRLWEYTLALAADPEPSRVALLRSVSYWLATWVDAEAATEPLNVTRAKTMLATLKETHAS